MRLTGKGVWGPPDDRDECIRVLRRAVELGVNFIDTADSYGPYVSEELIREALHPYDGVVIATKAGLLRTGPGRMAGSRLPGLSAPGVRDEPAPARASKPSTCSNCTASTTSSPLEDQIGELVALQQEGKIRHIGLSEVDVDQLEAAQKIATIVSVQNMYNLTVRTAEPVLEACEAQGVGFIPWFPLAAGPLAAPGGPLQRIAADHHATRLSSHWPGC